MSLETRIEWLAPPFAGHLFPLVHLAAKLRERGFVRQLVRSTPGARAAVEANGLEFAPLLAARADEVFAIANTKSRVAGAPWRMLTQLRQNLALCADLRRELAHTWRDTRPDLVVADFTLPVAGLLARDLGARWWTTTPSPCALETRTGTPSYLGGWRPPRTALGRLRDRAGNGVIRVAKRGLARLVRRELQALGVDDIHRVDGREVVYSGELVLALGAREFELPRADWPPALEFIGPVFQSAVKDGVRPQFEPGRVHVLVSLGTHLVWAKRRAAEVAMAAARRLPEWRFHFTLGRPALGEGAPGLDSLGLGAAPPNFTAFDYVPYDERLAGYDLALVHGGTGVLYACLTHGIPLLVWPHDYDQFDHAVRVEATGAGVRCTPRRAAEQLEALLASHAARAAATRMRHALAAYDPVAAFERHLERLG